MAKNNTLHDTHKKQETAVLVGVVTQQQKIEQAEEYLDILYSTKYGKGEILKLCQKYGTPEKEIASLKLKI